MDQPPRGEIRELTAVGFYPMFRRLPHLDVDNTAEYFSPGNLNQYSEERTLTREWLSPPRLPLSRVRSGQRAQAPLATTAADCSDYATGAIG